MEKLFENVTTVQFDHRLLATCLAVIVPIFWFIGIRQNLIAGTRLAFHLLLLTLIAQVSLGISTLLLYVPVGLAPLIRRCSGTIYIVFVPEPPVCVTGSDIRNKCLNAFGQSGKPEFDQYQFLTNRYRQNCLWRCLRSIQLEISICTPEFLPDLDGKRRRIFPSSTWSCSCSINPLPTSAL